MKELTMLRFVERAPIGVAILVGCCWLWPGSEAGGEDWFRWRGPQLNGVSHEKAWRFEWPAGGPPVCWRADVGIGFSAVTVAGNRALTLGNQDEVDTVYCLNAATGAVLWKHSYASPLDARFFEGGPTSTPTVDGAVVYTLGRQGQLFCLDLQSGKLRWTTKVHEKADVRIPGWGYSSSPVVLGELLILNVGEAGTAVNKKTGQIVWTSADKDAGYASAVPYQHAGRAMSLIFSGKYLIAVESKSGKEHWRYRWLTRFGANAADPIVRWPHVLISSAYNRGTSLLRIDGEEPVEVWRTKELQNELNACVLLGDYLYGIDGGSKTEKALKCVHWKTGEVQWAQQGFGLGTLMAADDKLIILSEQGELCIARASESKFAALARAPVIQGKCWTVPVLANGRIYCRNADGQIVCLNVGVSP